MLIFIICTILLEKITGGPSGPLAIIYFFSKKADIHTHKHTNTQTHKHTNRLGQKTPLIKVSL
jgi:hypothetical protein